MIILDWLNNLLQLVAFAAAFGLVCIVLWTPTATTEAQAVAPGRTTISLARAQRLLLAAFGTLMSVAVFLFSTHQAFVLERTILAFALVALLTFVVVLLAVLLGDVSVTGLRYTVLGTGAALVSALWAVWSGAAFTIMAGTIQALTLIGWLALTALLLSFANALRLLYTDDAPFTQILRIPLLLLAIALCSVTLRTALPLNIDSVLTALGLLLLSYGVLRVEFIEPLQTLQRQTHSYEADLHRNTQALQAEQARVQDLDKQLDDAQAHKQQFLNNMSHELRTPLNAIIGYSDLLLHNTYGGLTEKQHDRLLRIRHNSHYLVTLVSNVLDLQQADAATLKLDVCEFQLVDDALRPLLEDYQARCASKGLQLHVKHPSHIPQLRGDPQRISQIFDQLLDNAVKFTEAGHIRVTVDYLQVVAGVLNTTANDAEASQHSQPALAEALEDDLPESSWLRDGRWVLVRVNDTGIGMSSYELQRVFQRFHQHNPSATRKHAGVGLGLALAQHLVDLHDGVIWAQSTPSTGSTFSVALPVLPIFEPGTIREFALIEQ